ncbi:hypothetical protein DICVIV_13196 [Dictyocaulus viviparus]|uniref:Flavodoxin-like domain-containing protein n=1 Tax=Dictyocaulus viviparus TaxID=29172 RepID=A0A0D8XB18_DICVI|nr:hypothetical protein DICVIV_13196 [Dictyocaulus viviparus]
MAAEQPGPPWIHDGEDEILLYFTAFLGVVLPAVVYFIYHKIHAIYMKYAEKKESERLADEAARSEIVIISLCTEDSPAERFSTHLQSLLTEELINPPILWPIENLNTKDLMNFKGFCIFVVETLTNGKASRQSEWFLEWLEDIAADVKQKKKAHFEAVKFAIVGFGSLIDGESYYNKVSQTVLKRMKILGSKQIMSVALFDTSQPELSFSKKYDELAERLLQAIDRNLPGVHGDNETDSMSEWSDESEEERETHDKKKI